ncbi:MAG: methionyl-tRNA formyltransferase, partial [Bacteroidales bacterium]|nr:methionyl-tRNA formyltransferase [Bacteroidales bacterium]
MNSRGRIVFMGTPQFAVAPLRRLIEEGFDIAAVVTVPDKPSGRGLVPTPSDVKIYADSCKIPVLQPVSLKDPQFLESLNAFKANLFIVVAFRMLPKEVWSMPSLGTFNLHASLLPDYRGAAPINWALINGETKTGVTTFLIDEKIDTGAILFREECEISEEDNAEALHD